MRTSFLIVITVCLLLLGLGIAWDTAVDGGVVNSLLRYLGELTAEPDPRPEEEKDIVTRALNAIAMWQHKQSVNTRSE